jgi:hypothetical protein
MQWSRRHLVALIPLLVIALAIGQWAVAGSSPSSTSYLPLIYTAEPTPTSTPTPTVTPTLTPSHTPTPTATPAGTNPYVHGTVGYDISVPGCTATVSPTSSSGTPYQFAIVGVNGGRAFYPNSCLLNEFQVATGLVPIVSFYMNINGPFGTYAYEGQNGPKGQCSSGDNPCLSYNFGYNAAQSATIYAASTIGPAAANRMYWLDVETANSWWDNTTPNFQALNDDVLQGAIDYFHQNGRTVGIYSILSMYNQSSPVLVPAAMAGSQSMPLVGPQIAGNGYQPGVSEWISGASDLNSAPSFCSTPSFTGGLLWLVQRPMNNPWDENYAC